MENKDFRQACLEVDDIEPCQFLQTAYGSLPELSVATLLAKNIKIPPKLFRLMRGDGDDITFNLAAFAKALEAGQSAMTRAQSILISVDDGSSWKQDYVYLTSDPVVVLAWLVESRKPENKRRETGLTPSRLVHLHKQNNLFHYTGQIMSRSLFASLTPNLHCIGLNSN